MPSEPAPGQNFETEKWRAEHDFELDKWRADLTLRTREVALKEQEQTLRDEEVAIKRQEVRLSRWTNPLALAIFGAAFAGLVNAGLTWWNNRYQYALEQSKSEAARILEMIKTNDSDRAAENLGFLVNSGLISEPMLVEKVGKFLASRKAGTGPFLSSDDLKLAKMVQEIGEKVKDLAAATSPTKEQEEELKKMFLLMQKPGPPAVQKK